MNELLEKIKSGELVRRGNKLFTKDQIISLDKAEEQIEYFELRQMSKKLTLRF